MESTSCHARLNALLWNWAIAHLQRDPFQQVLGTVLILVALGWPPTASSGALTVATPCTRRTVHSTVSGRGSDAQRASEEGGSRDKGPGTPGKGLEEIGKVHFR
ncbi:hypothetical protein ASPBRDRAFT_246016 [Aspergillus brasiliensis CBS 101740]|uniref:Uncharacterized protein n=1 Tax=Aspergillus brasiliensis (strain CBS 101740 / IMI 381727 / IBT 21946) TaxID=767769 RepID=A0A1L9V144_ASPBC|nr:hypothetical protein ASPBRDRAFT_246016 [Aspergillus brasiliensis CBS 101740]